MQYDLVAVLTHMGRNADSGNLNLFIYLFIYYYYYYYCNKIILLLIIDIYIFNQVTTLVGSDKRLLTTGVSIKLAI